MSGGRGRIDDVLAGIAAAQAAGFSPIKLNCVVQRGVNEDQVLPLAAFAREHGHVLRFIEYMDVGTCNGWRRENVVPSAELRDRLHARWPLRALDPNYRGEVAARYAYDDGAGEVGFVSSVTVPFCGDCHRARVSADGTLYTCLFAADGQPLRALVRQGEDVVVDALAQAWTRRADRYSEIRGAATTLAAPCRDVPGGWLTCRRAGNPSDACVRDRPAGDGRCLRQGDHRARRRAPNAA